MVEKNTYAGNDIWIQGFESARCDAVLVMRIESGARRGVTKVRPGAETKRCSE